MTAKKPKPEEVKKVLAILSKDTIKTIQKKNPFRNERNAKIRELIDCGIKLGIIAEISGFHRCHIGIIKKKGLKTLQ